MTSVAAIDSGKRGREQVPIEKYISAFKKFDLDGIDFQAARSVTLAEATVESFAACLSRASAPQLTVKGHMNQLLRDNRTFLKIFGVVLLLLGVAGLVLPRGSLMSVAWPYDVFHIVAAGVTQR